MAIEARQKILKAASVLFLKGGVSALSVRAIAKRAGVSTIGIYSHFQGKQGILDALYIEGFERVSDAMNVETEGREPRDIILEATRGYLEIAENYEAHYRLIFGESDPDYTPSAEATAASVAAFQQLTSHAALLLPEKAPLKLQQRTALRFWALVHGFTSLRQHAVATLIPAKDWKKLILESVEAHLDTIEERPI